LSTRPITDICFFGGFDDTYPRNSVLKKGLEALNVRVTLCRTSPRRRSVKRYALLAYRYMRLKRDFPVIYVPEFRHKDIPLAWFLARLTGKRVIFDPLVSRYDTKIGDRADAGARSFQAWHNRNLDRISMGLADLVLADTEAHAQYYDGSVGTPRRKIRVLPVGFDEDLFVFDPARARAKRTPRDNFVVLFFGNYLPLHGVDTIAEAAAMLRDRPAIRFVLIGRGQTFDVVEKYVSEHELTNVDLLPRVPIESLAAKIAGADVSLGVFGRTEKAGRVVANKIYQSMAVGTPVITADSPAVREFFADGETIRLVPPGDAGALAAAIRALHDDRGLGAAIGERAARFVHDRFSSRSIAARFLEYCREIAG
jgi:glycosyltransferase involved in cell wall biosynthesis